HSYLQHHAGSCAICDCLSFTKIDSKPETLTADILQIQKKFRESKCPHETIEYGLCLECGLGSREREALEPHTGNIKVWETVILMRKEDLKKIQKINNNIDYGSNQKQSRINWYLNKYLSEKKS
ncbi:hypothetical protein LCGC14_2051260, partial [marine sediment metagenome]